MCFISTEYSKLKTAETDVECWKILKEGYKSKYKNYIYKKGVLNPLVKLYKDSWYEINQGYHSYRSEEKARNNFNFLPDRYMICKFIIPAGTHYYANVNGEYVSEQIMLVK
jgi:hypothetical protein